MFAGPHKLIQKRRDKLLDYDNCKERAERLKDKRVQEELQAARNNYEALNAQLLDELPKFHHAAEDLFTSCVRGFAQAQRDFVSLTLGELTPLLQVRTLFHHNLHHWWSWDVFSLLNSFKLIVMVCIPYSYLAWVEQKEIWCLCSKKSTHEFWIYFRASVSFPIIFPLLYASLLRRRLWRSRAPRSNKALWVSLMQTDPKQTRLLSNVNVI